MDTLNAELAKLLQRRAALARRIGRLKAGITTVAKDARREQLMLRRFVRCRGAFSPLALSRILRAVLRESRVLVQRELRR
jgi:chorismate mutase